MYPVDELRKNWNKWTSIEFLKKHRLNTPAYQLISNLDELRSNEILSKEERVSVRVFVDRGVSFNEPHLPNQVNDDKFKEVLNGLLRNGYSLMVCKAIDPEGTKLKGNIRLENGYNILHVNFVLEWMGAGGTVRDLESATSKEIFQCTTPQQVRKELGLEGLVVLNDAIALFWGQPIVLEWSVYIYPVGARVEKVIYWELRRG